MVEYIPIYDPFIDYKPKKTVKRCSICGTLFENKCKDPFNAAYYRCKKCTSWKIKIKKFFF